MLPDPAGRERDRPASRRRAICATGGRALILAPSFSKAPAAYQRRKSCPWSMTWGGVDDARTDDLREFSLAVGKALLGVRILPADVVPVVHVQGEGHHAPRRSRMGPGLRAALQRLRLGSQRREEHGQGKPHAVQSKRRGRRLPLQRDNAGCP